MATNLIEYAAPKETCEKPQSHTEPKHCPDSPTANTYNEASSEKFVVNNDSAGFFSTYKHFHCTTSTLDRTDSICLSVKMLAVLE